MSGNDVLHCKAICVTHCGTEKLAPKRWMKMIPAFLSVGEVVDKVTILEIKSDRISDTDKLRNIATELDALRPLVSGGVFDAEEVVALTDALRAVNGELWDIEDDIRAEEAAGRFGERFIELARAVMSRMTAVPS